MVRSKREGKAAPAFIAKKGKRSERVKPGSNFKGNSYRVHITNTAMSTLRERYRPEFERLLKIEKEKEPKPTDKQGLKQWTSRIYNRATRRLADNHRPEFENIKSNLRGNDE